MLCGTNQMGKRKKKTKLKTAAPNVRLVLTHFWQQISYFFFSIQKWFNHLIAPKSIDTRRFNSSFIPKTFDILFSKEKGLPVELFEIQFFQYIRNPKWNIMNKSIPGMISKIENLAKCVIGNFNVSGLWSWCWPHSYHN